MRNVQQTKRGQFHDCRRQQQQQASYSSAMQTATSLLLVIVLISLIVDAVHTVPTGRSRAAAAAASIPSQKQLDEARRQRCRERSSSTSARRRFESQQSAALLSSSCDLDDHDELADDEYVSSANSVLQLRAGGPSKHNSKVLDMPPPKPEQPTSASAWMHGLKSGMASAMAAFCVKTVLQPIDAVKTIQQYHRQKSASSLTLLQACREIMNRPGGFWNFYAGLGVTVFGAMPGVALYFGVYSYCKKSLLQTEFGERHKTFSIAVSAAIGNSVASFSRVPYEVVKQKLQTAAYGSTLEAFQAIWASETWWRLIFPKGGVSIQMLRDVPYAVVTLLLYESLQAHFAPSDNGGATTNDLDKQRAARSQKKVADFILGGIAGGLGSWVTNPMDVVKTRLQTDSDLYGGSVWKCTSSVWQEGGFPAFLRGAVPRLMHKVPANAFFFLFYEFFKRVLKVEESAPAPSAAKNQVSPPVITTAKALKNTKVTASVGAPRRKSN